MRKISQEQAEKIRDVQLANAMKRLKEGKPLSLGEQRLVDQATGERKHGTAPTMAQASKRMGLPIEILKAAKRAGAPGFKYSRVDCDAVSGWLENNKPAVAGDRTSAEGAKLRKLNAEADTKEFLLAIKMGQYLLKAAVENTVARCLGSVRSLLQQKLEQEYPAAVAGLSVVEARIKGKALFDDICAELRKLDQPWAV